MGWRMGGGCGPELVDGWVSCTSRLETGRSTSREGCPPPTAAHTHTTAPTSLPSTCTPPCSPSLVPSPSLPHPPMPPPFIKKKGFLLLGRLGRLPTVGDPLCPAPNARLVGAGGVSKCSAQQPGKNRNEKSPPFPPPAPPPFISADARSVWTRRRFLSLGRPARLPTVGDPLRPAPNARFVGGGGTSK